MSAPTNTPTPSDAAGVAALLRSAESSPETRQTALHRSPATTHAAAARSFLWRYLGAAFSFPDEATVAWLRDNNTRATVHDAVVGAICNRDIAGHLSQIQFAPTEDAYLAVFGHTVRGDCPPHEIEYGELKADALFQPHRLADITAFYRAFGLEVASDANDRVDNIAMECEFFSVLCAKEAVADQPEHLEICRNAQKQFLREHLARWVPAFTRRVESLAADEFFPAHARLLRETVTAECARYGLQAGNSDLQLRPAGDIEDPCGSCGLAGTQFPGAVAQAT